MLLQQTTARHLKYNRITSNCKTNKQLWISIAPVLVCKNINQLVARIRKHVIRLITVTTVLPHKPFCEATHSYNFL